MGDCWQGKAGRGLVGDEGPWNFWSCSRRKKYSIWAKICVVFYTWRASLRRNVW